MPRGGATSSRGRGKFKVARGGGRHFSRDLDPRRAQQENESSSEEEEESSDEEDDGATGQHGAGGVKLAPQMAAMNLKLGNTEEVGQPGEGEMNRAEKKALRKAQADKEAAGKGKKQDSGSESDEESEGDELLNPWKAAETRQAEKVKSKAAQPAAPPPPTRKEREAAEKKAAQERYQKLHAQGKTNEAQTDLARLQEVRRRRDAAAAQRQAETDEIAKDAAAKKEKAASRKL